MIQEVLERVKAAEALADGRLSEARTEAEAILKAAKLKAEAMVKDVSVQHVKVSD
jgi:vacuolar-type H+-ATPase subunit H